AFPRGKMPQRVPPAWHSEMPLPGKLLLSAAALLLLSLAFRFYRNRSPPAGKIPPGEQRENRDGDGALRRRRRRRKDSGEKAGNGPGMRHAALRGEQGVPRNEEEEEEEEGEEVGSEPGVMPRKAPLGPARAERELGRKPGWKLGVQSESEAGVELGRDPGSRVGKEPGSEPGSRPGNNPGRQPGSEPGSKLIRKPRNDPGSEQANELGNKLGINTGSVRTLSVTSRLGLLLTASGPGSDTAHCFSSVATIRVEENFIPERRDKAGDSPPRPGLRGKVYDYFVQSVSESVTRPTSLPFVPAGTSQRRRERGRAEPQGSGTHGESPDLEIPDPPTPNPDLEIPDPPTPNPDLEIPDPSTSNPDLEIPDPNTPAAPEEGTESPAEPPPPGWKGSTRGIAPAGAPELPQVSPPGRVHLGNCSEVLCAAKARQLRALRDAALQVMSQNLLQVLRSPHIYGRLNAAERELLPALRSRGRPRLVVADVPPAEPGHRRGRLCYYDEDGDRWCQLCPLPAEVAGRGCAVRSMFNYLFLVPGWEGAGRARSPSHRVLCYDPLGDSWRDICPLRQARPRCQLVALDGHLYAIGGECLATVERYDPRRDRWAFAAALPGDTFAVAHAATACDGDIYVTGGTLRSLLLRYDARGDRWATGAAVGDKDGTAELVSAHGFLYRLQVRRGAGGSEVAVWRCRASAGLWYRCASRALPEPAGLRCAALGGLVHCLGRDLHLRFLADPVSPRFGAKELRPFPAPHGSLLPAVLVLPEAGAEPPGL
ncbi:KLD7A protein, partial [Chloropsis hardwickii]|nr:KLD7A protein [Chloropsis hardwickii]